MASAAGMLEDEDAVNTTSLYATLNVPRTASQEDITRAYRRLAQVFHPDKHADEAKRRAAQESFAKVQEAYEVLGDSQRRQVYDVYGKAGLAAGLEVGTHLRTREEIRREWEEFRAKQRRAATEQAVVQKGSYICRVDARRLINGQGFGSGPLFRSVIAQSALEAVVGDSNVLTVSGQAAVRPAFRRTPHGLEEVTFGGGNVVFGYKRIISEDDTLDAIAQLGLQTLLSVTSTRRLCRMTNRYGWLNASWNPQLGVGLEAGCSQSLFNSRNEGSVQVVLAPKAATGVAATVTHRGPKYALQGKLEIGVVHAVSGRVSVFLNDCLTLRAIGRLGTSGIDLELGLARKWSPAVVAYVGTTVGYPSGVVLKLRATRAGLSLECPIQLSGTFTDSWRLVAASYILPPLLYLATTKLVVQPLLAWSKSAKERQQREQLAEATWAALGKAAEEQALVEAVARRKLATELAVPNREGLIIVKAVYGILDEYHARAPTLQASGEGQATPPADTRGTDPADSTAQSTQADARVGGAEDVGEAAEASGAVGAAPAGTASAPHSSPKAPPDPWMDVTLPLQYLVADSKLLLHGGLPKAGLMGFTDPAPHTTQPKQLRLMYTHQDKMYQVVVGDEEELRLPGAGQIVTDNRLLLALNKRLQAIVLGLA